MKSRIQSTITALISLIFIVQTGFTQGNVAFDDANFKEQQKELKAAVKKIKEADLYFETGQTGMLNRALPLYLEANSFNPSNASLNYKIGVCYIQTINKIESKKHFEKAKQLDPNVAPDIDFYLGMANHLNYEFDNAIAKYKEYLADLDPSKVADRKGIVMRKIEECNNGKKLVADTVRINEDGDTVRVIVQNIGETLNTVYAEYNPVTNADESVMFFTSQREGQISPEDQQFYEDIYFTEGDTAKNWGKPVNPGKPLNDVYNDAIVGLSPDGQKLFTYKGVNGGDIYVSDLKGDSWSKPKPLNSNINTEYKETSASFSYDGRTIYFVSNRKAGEHVVNYGNSDIYKSTLDAKGEWGEAVNLGPVINTLYDERGVFMHPDGKTIYFSSKGHNTMGGLDIFKSEMDDDGNWSVPENIGYPVNTPDDDAFFSISANGQRGYYSSIKPGGYGSHDIYKVLFKASPPKLTLLRGLIVDHKTNEPIEARIEITDLATNEVISTFNSNSKTGKYLISLPSGKNYGITVKADNYLFHSENIDVPKSYSYREIERDIKLKSIAVGSKIVLNNIFFDYGKATLRSESKNELDRLVKMMNDIPTLKIEISGHTDNKGSLKLNTELSADRAKAVMDYVVANGIPASRMKSAGYGYSRPIATNDTDEGRQLNRRTEFEVLSR